MCLGPNVPLQGRHRVATREESGVLGFPSSHAYTAALSAPHPVAGLCMPAADPRLCQRLLDQVSICRVPVWISGPKPVGSGSTSSSAGRALSATCRAVLPGACSGQRCSTVNGFFFFPDSSGGSGMQLRDPCCPLKGTLGPSPDSLPATPKSPPTRRVPPWGLELRRPWGFSPEARRGSQGASRAAPGPWLPLETRPDSPGEPGMQPRDPCLPWRGKLGPGHTLR